MKIYPFHPGPPEPSVTPPEIMDVTKSSVALAWSRPKDDGGSAITGYFVEYKEVSSESWSRHQTKITSTMFTVPGLTPDTDYQFHIVAVNDIGESQAGPMSDPVTCKDPFGESRLLMQCYYLELLQCLHWIGIQRTSDNQMNIFLCDPR